MGLHTGNCAACQVLTADPPPYAMDFKVYNAHIAYTADAV